MRKAITLLMTIALLVSLCVPAFAFQAQLSAQSLSVNGTEIACEKYNIDGSNYFKLRDLAKLLDGTGSQFDVGWDAETGVVSITTNHAYTTATGTELVVGEDQSASTQPSAQTIMIDGTVRTDLSVFNIGGNNYFQLRQLGDALGFKVDYDNATHTMLVMSSDFSNNDTYNYLVSFTKSKGTQDDSTGEYHVAIKQGSVERHGDEIDKLRGTNYTKSVYYNMVYNGETAELKLVMTISLVGYYSSFTEYEILIPADGSRRMHVASNDTRDGVLSGVIDASTFQGVESDITEVEADYEYEPNMQLDTLANNIRVLLLELDQSWVFQGENLQYGVRDLGFTLQKLRQKSLILRYSVGPNEIALSEETYSIPNQDAVINVPSITVSPKTHTISIGWYNIETQQCWTWEVKNGDKINNGSTVGVPAGTYRICVKNGGTANLSGSIMYSVSYV